MKRTFVTYLLFSFLSVLPLAAKIRTRLPFTAYDGGVISAETLGRGGTIASNRGTHAAGSENPASLASGLSNSMYTTVLFGPSSSLSDDTLDNNDSLRNRTLQYLSIGAQKGVLFYEPIGRIREREPDQDLDFTANAIGFAGVDNFGHGGQVGVSLAYLWSSLVTQEHRSGSPDIVTSDTMSGLRLNLGLRYPMGPTMWGISVLNGPGFLWGKNYNRELLPVRVRVGQTWKIHQGFLLSVDGERRYYNEGGNDVDLAYVGAESFVSENFALRFGVYGEKIDQSKKRHVTTGATIKTKTKSTLSYAYEVFYLENEKVKRSVLSFQFPLSSADEK